MRASREKANVRDAHCQVCVCMRACACVRVSVHACVSVSCTVLTAAFSSFFFITHPYICFYLSDWQRSEKQLEMFRNAGVPPKQKVTVFKVTDNALIKPGIYTYITFKEILNPCTVYVTQWTLNIWYWPERQVYSKFLMYSCLLCVQALLSMQHISVQANMWTSQPNRKFWSASFRASLALSLFLACVSRSCPRLSPAQHSEDRAVSLYVYHYPLI